MSPYSVAALLMCLVQFQAHGGFTTYANGFPEWFPGEQEWHAGLSSSQIIDFVSEFEQPLNNQYAELGVLFPTNDWIIAGNSFQDHWGVNGGNPIGSTIDITFDQPQYAFGVYFPGSASFELFWKGEEIFQSIGWSFDETSFLGVIGDQPFDQVRIKDSDGAVFIDDIVWGTPWAVPGPGALVALGLGVFFGRSRRRNG